MLLNILDKWGIGKNNIYENCVKDCKFWSVLVDLFFIY